MILPALYVRSQWARRIAEGSKSIETRGYRMPDKYLGEWVAIVQSNRGEKSKVVCLAYISGSFKYISEQEFRCDAAAHRIPKGHILYDWGTTPEKWGWKIAMVAGIGDPWFYKVWKGGRVWTQCSVGIDRFLEAVGGYRHGWRTESEGSDG